MSSSTLLLIDCSAAEQIHQAPNPESAIAAGVAATLESRASRLAPTVGALPSPTSGAQTLAVEPTPNSSALEAAIVPETGASAAPAVRPSPATAVSTPTSTPADGLPTSRSVTVQQINCQAVDFSGSDPNHVESTQMHCLDDHDGIEFDVHSLGSDNWLAVSQTDAPSGATQIVMPDGLKYTDTAIGAGAEALSGKTAVVHYTGWLLDGTKIYSSRDRNQPFAFVLGEGRGIKGWDEGVAGMRVGGKRTLVIPPELGYGAIGVAGVIPANATLRFEVELIDVR